MRVSTNRARWPPLCAALLVACSQGAPASRSAPTSAPTSLSPHAAPAGSAAAPPSAVAGTPSVQAVGTTGAGRGGADGARVVPVRRMALARATHAAARLPSGQVLIAGGCTRDGCELDEGGASAELYSPESDSFARTGRMTMARAGLAAATLPDGRVLIVGGWGRDGVLASAETYDPGAKSFLPTGSMTVGRGGYTATALRDGRVLVAGGYDGSRSLASAELYDPRKGTFARTGGMGTPRSAHTATLLPDGRVLIVGGSRDDGVLGSAELYDPRTGRFSRSGSMAVVRYKHAAVALRDGTVLVLGGSDALDARATHASAEIYDPATGAFSPTGGMRDARFKLPDAVALLPSGEALVGGGGAAPEVYAPEARAFRLVEGSVGAPWAFATATPLGDGRVLLAGGYDENIRLTRRAWVYEPTGARQQASRDGR